ncbi:MAG: gliding motility protein GldN, partial [Bacteroidetes bacterium]|nr:gliding motility protein GldN [Bacteroidota bacterium]
KELVYSYDTIEVYNPELDLFESVVVMQELNLENIHRIRIKEDWVFDEETSTLKVRILGIAPVLDRYDENGNFIGEMPLFWAHYPSLRYILANYESFNPFNDAHRLS